MFAALTYYDNVSTVNISNDFLMKNYHHGNLKEELTACAVKICESEGYANLSIRKLAKESNVSQTAPYRHFETKEHLYAEVAKIGFIELQKTVSKGKTFIDKGKEYLNFGLKKQNLYDLMFDKVVEDFSDYPDLLDAANKTAEDLQRSFAKFSGIEDEHEINIKSFTIWATIHGMVGIFRTMPEDPAEGSIMVQAADVFNNIDDYLDKVLTSIAKA